MNKLVIVVTLSMMSFISFGQKIKDKDVPQQIRNSFHQKYPNVKVVHWDQEGKNYEAGFEKSKVHHSVLFNAEAKIIETEVNVKLIDLPKKSLSYIKEHYKNQKIDEVAKIVTNDGTILYEIEIQGKDIIFDQNGTHIMRGKV